MPFVIGFLVISQPSLPGVNGRAHEPHVGIADVISAPAGVRETNLYSARRTDGQYAIRAWTS